MNVLPLEKRVRIIGALVEGCSIRATERMADTHRDTIMRLGARVGEGCARLHDELMQNLQCATLELDEQWSFIFKKQKRVGATDPREYGDNYVWIALDANRKAVVSYRVGKRTAADARAFVADLRRRVVNRPQVTSDGYAPYLNAVDLAFRSDVDFAQLVKIYESVPGNDAAHRYSPGRIRDIEKTIICGQPDENKISTSFVERFNLSTRMHNRRYTRLTNGFSKTIENHRASVALHIGWYNLCRVHETLRCTPAMAIGVAKHIWSIEELVSRALAMPAGMPEQPIPPYRPHNREEGLPADRRPFKLVVLPGGKMAKPRR